jgi:hypothetical protein
MEGKMHEITEEKMNAMRQAMYTAYCMVRAFDAHLQFTLPAKDAGVTKLCERDAVLLRNQGQRTLAMLEAEIPRAWFSHGDSLAESLPAETA